MNASIELHDSTISGVSQDDAAITLLFTPAYIHKSDGRPGMDSGSGWTQDLRLVIGAGSLTGQLPEFPCDVQDGELVLGTETHPNGIPIPFGADVCPVILRLVFYPGFEMKVGGESLRLELIGEPVYVEEFHP